MGMGVPPVKPYQHGHVEDVAGLEGVPMRMAVCTARPGGSPEPGAEPATPGWTDGCGGLGRRPPPSVRHHVLPLPSGAGIVKGLT
ncbi:hypothetical protein GCM10022224_060690 [Nonomuraea antimicrobica]|uniref:Uncharacterized protein n=1 Tax=Nonomuraea antimicrobica TaxID=561173 RepID=A0ABP7CFU8_9ACTN